MADDLISLASCAGLLGTSTRRLRYYLEKTAVIPDRRLTAGKFHVRYFTAQDYQIIKQWWSNIDKGGTTNG
jgi:DNA-binding transcriptional MerR regulator